MQGGDIKLLIEQPNVDYGHFIITHLDRKLKHFLLRFGEVIKNSKKLIAIKFMVKKRISFLFTSEK